MSGMNCSFPMVRHILMQLVETYSAHAKYGRESTHEHLGALMYIGLPPKASTTVTYGSHVHSMTRCSASSHDAVKFMNNHEYAYIPIFIFLNQRPPFPFSDRISFVYTGSAFIIIGADNLETFTRGHNEGLGEVKRVRTLILPIFVSNPTRPITRISSYTTGVNPGYVEDEGDDIRLPP